MIIKGNTVGTPMPRSNWNQNDPTKADYIIGHETVDAAIAAAQETANNGVTAAGNAQTAADNAQTAADNALTAAGNAQTNAEKNAKEYTDSKHNVFTATLTTNDWEGDAAPYTQTIGIEGILETDRPHYGVVYSDDTETALAQKEAFAMVDDLDTEDGSVTFTCFEEKPEVNLTVHMEVNR